MRARRPPARTLVLVLGLAATPVVVTGRAWAQENYDRAPWEGGFTRSLGRPPIWRPQFSALAGVHGEGSERVATGYGVFGVSKAVGNPVVGLLSVVGEGWLGYRNVDVQGGGRAFLFSPYFRVGAGVDYDARSRTLDPLVTWSTPWRRGGILGAGTTIRLDYMPSRGQSVAMGITVPLWNRNAGRTRPFTDRVSLRAPRPGRVVPDSPTPALREVLDSLRFAARRINLLTTPFIDQKPQDPARALRGTVGELQSIFATGPAAVATRGGVEAEVRTYHAWMARAFAIASAGHARPAADDLAAGARLAAVARTQLLDHVLLPYNRLLGQRKRHDRLDRFRAVAWAAFVREMGAVEPRSARWQEIVYVFQNLLDIAEQNRALARQRWGDDRLVWLPLQYGLLPEEHDTRTKLDGIVARAVGRSFTEGNRVAYLLTDQFQHELTRSLHAARDYHVLWIHDFPGRNAAGEPDRVAFTQMLEYLRALTRRVQEYDAAGRLPVFIILLDQLYYEVNRSRLWLRLLEDPLRERLRLDRDDPAMARELAAVQDSLRLAVETSELLRLEARQYGRDWLRNLIKVHVNVTNPADYTFNSAQIVPILGIPDNLMRDHRKILFYDLTEEDPYRGLAVYTGMGVGEHYTGPAWEDRALLLQGPAALSVRRAVLEVLTIHGFAADEIPWPLRPRPFPDDYQARIRQQPAGPGGDAARVLEVHNGTGYAPKEVEVVKATLYTLAPAGTVIKVPDSLWGSQLFGGMLLGAALRGVRVLVMAPSLASAPSAGWPQMARAYELLARLLVLEEALEDEIREAGGLLKVGIYHPEAPVGDLAARFGVFGPDRPAPDWFRELFAFHPQVASVGARVGPMLEAMQFRPDYLGGDEAVDPMAVRPRLHLKGHFIASADVWESVVRQPSLAPALEAYVALRARSMEHWRHDLFDPIGMSDDVIRRMRGVLAAGWGDGRPGTPEEAVAYLTVGSPNQDYRSLMLDGEAMVVVSGVHALVGFFDFVVIAGQCRWVESLEELQELLPEPGNVKRLLARWIKTLL
jgi:hypothetical protein